MAYTVTPFALFTSRAERTWAVRILPVGARYGQNRLRTIHDETTVEFYDTTYADDGDGNGDGFGPLGQFVGRYYLSTLLGIDQYGSGDGHGLKLDLQILEWQIDAATMDTVRAWLRGYSEELCAAPA